MSEQLIAAERLTVITAEIRTIQAQTRTTILTAACEIGKRLQEVKNGMAFGKWTAWLSENVECSEKQAQNMMRLYEEYGKNPMRAIPNINVSQAIALLSAPEDVRAELIDNGAAAELSVRELRAEIAQKKEEIEKSQITIDELTKRAENAEKLKGVYEKSVQDAERERTAAEVKAQNSAEAERVAKMDTEKEKRKTAAAETEAKELKARIEELENAPADVVQVEVVPPEVEMELEKLRETVRKAPDKAVILARDAYDRGIAEFRTCRALMDEMGEENMRKYARAFAAGLRKMADAMDVE